MFRRLLTLSAFLVLTGCALPVPLSEGMMFGDRTATHQGPLTSLWPGGTQPLGGVGVAASFYPPGFGETLARHQGHEYGSGQNRAYQVSLPAPQFGFGLPGRGAFAFSPGAGIVGMSLNGTLLLIGEQFVTAQATLTPIIQGEVILQRRLLHASGSGLSAGAFYRYELQDDDLVLADDGGVRMHVLGLRTAYAFHSYWLRLQGFTSLGYAPNFDVPVFGFGLMHTF